MAFIDIAIPPKPLACEVSAYNDEELDRYLEANGRTISVRDPENIAPEFIQRLRDKVRSEREATRARPVDLDQVAARLQVLSDNIERPARQLSPTPTPPSLSQAQQDLEDLREETEAYPALVKAGGRPPYPFHLLEDIFQNPEQYLQNDAYHDIIMFWRGRFLFEDARTCMAGCHLLRWNWFCSLQRIIRERSVESEDTLFSAACWDSWDEFIGRHGSSEGQWSFSDYEKRTKERLGKYGFTRPFQLKSDLSRQDTLTTWIEYLGYEYRFYDLDASCVKRFERWYDKAWKTVVDLGVLRPGDTYEVVRGYKAAVEDWSEEETAKKTLQSATTAVLTAEEAFTRLQTSKGSRQAPPKCLLAAQAALNTAQMAYDSIKRRSDVITDYIQRTKGHCNRRDNAQRHEYLLRWIHQQIPLIELESKPSESDNIDIGCMANRERSKSIETKDVHDRQCWERRVYDSGDSRSVLIQEIPADYTSQGSGKRKHSGHEILEDSPSSKRLKDESHGAAVDSVSYSTNEASEADLRGFESTRATGDATSEPRRSDVEQDGSPEVLRPLRRSSRIAQQPESDTMSALTSMPSLHAMPNKASTRYLRGTATEHLPGGGTQ